MKYIVNTILQKIEEQQPDGNKQLRIRISGFENIGVYERVAEKIHEKYDPSLSVETRLSYEKWNIFKNAGSTDQSALLSMEQNDWIARDCSLTYYRNLSTDQAQVIVLMGTEAVDDQGGLSDCYYIDPDRLATELNGNFHKLVSKAYEQWDVDEEKCIDKLFSDLFSLLPLNICKLSDIVDQWGSFDVIEDFISRFYMDLPLWGLCKCADSIPTFRKIIRNQRKNLLQTNYGFVSRNMFKRMSKKAHSAHLSHISEYGENAENIYNNGWSGWADQSVSSYQEYSAILAEFITGINVEINRDKLLGVDFSVTETILNIKDSGPQEKRKEKKFSVYGSPLIVFEQAIMSSILTNDSDEFDEIEIWVKAVELADAIDPTSMLSKEEQLCVAWEEVCWNAGGVFQFLSNYVLTNHGKELRMTVEPENIFDPACVNLNVSSGIISVASASKKLNKIIFEISHINHGVKTDIKQSFEWKFTLQDDWVIAFKDICHQYEIWNEQQFDAVLPLITANNFSSMMNAKSEEEFIDFLEQTNFNYECNLLDKINALNLSDSKAKQWNAEFTLLGRAFIDCCQSICKHGFYGDIVQAMNQKSKVTDFIDRFETIGKNIVDSDFTQNLEWVMDYYIHAFVLEPTARAITTQEETPACIVPPYHPAVLQKIADQAVFIADGCSEWLHNNEDKDISFETVGAAVNELSQLAQIQEGIDIFQPYQGKYLNAVHAFANYCLCGHYVEETQTWMSSIIQKDAVFDDDFKESTFKQLSLSAKMLLDVINNYIKAMPNSANNLAIAIIDPDDLQPVISALYHHIMRQKKTMEDDTQSIQVKLNILVKPENQGGKNYLSYWANTFFSQDENVNIKIYLNEWNDGEDLNKLLDQNLDIVFLMDVLKGEKIDFARKYSNNITSISDCRFPIVFRPKPVSSTNVKRRIELTQRQFGAATIHSQVVYYRNNYEQYDYQEETVVREVSIDKERQDMILMLHKKANWVVCCDGGMDGALLRDGDSESHDYSVIGFSTGKGPHGQYNLTVTARASIIDAVEERLRARLAQSFHWDKYKTSAASKVCMQEAERLDGISLLSAINPYDNNVNEFLAYVLSSLQTKQQEKQDALCVMIHLDSYAHWFENDVLEESLDSESRPDFLMITAKLGTDKVVELKAEVVECKIAFCSQAQGHLEKATKQVEHGINRLSLIFDPQSKSIKRRYWYAQLYRALAFSQITFSDNTAEYKELAAAMCDILEGHFRITWSGRIMGYWKDMQGDSENVAIISQNPDVEYHEIPQRMIQRLLLGDDQANVEYVPIVEEQENAEDEMNDDDEEEVDTFEGAADQEEQHPPMEQRMDDLVQDQTNQKQDTITSGSSEHQNSEVTTESEPNPDNNNNGLNVPTQEISHNDAIVEDTQKAALRDIRVYIGKDRLNNKIYWDFGHPQLANRHMLITGTSGQGKTYSIQAMLQELSEKGVSAAIFDYTEGFRIDQLEPEFKEALGDKITQEVIYFTGVPINPFRRHEIEIAGMKMEEKVSDVAQRIANIFAHVYSFKEQQFSAIYEACRAGIEKYGKQMNMMHFKEELADVSNPAAKTVLSKMAPFLDSVEFEENTEFNWDKITRSNGTVTIFQLTNFVREIQVIITELMLWDAWHYNKKHGDKETPFVVVLDEAQNLSHKADSPSAMILTEGRKFGWSAWFATQSLKVLDDDEIVRLQNAAFKLYFKPTDDELPRMAKQLDPGTPGGGQWLNHLKHLHKGQAIVVGDRIKPNGEFGSVAPTITNIASFKERENDKN